MPLLLFSQKQALLTQCKPYSLLPDPPFNYFHSSPRPSLPPFHLHQIPPLLHMHHQHIRHLRILPVHPRQPVHTHQRRKKQPHLHERELLPDAVAGAGRERIEHIVRDGNAFVRPEPALGDEIVCAREEGRRALERVVRGCDLRL